MKNTRIHSNMLDCWRDYQPQAKLISLGSSCTYPESKKPIPESQFGMPPVHPSVRGYASAKQFLALGSELYARQYGMEYLHCVLATMYGPHDHTKPDRSHFIGGMMHRAFQEKQRGEKRFSLWGNPKVTRECLYVEDQISAILAACDHFTNQIINCGANSPITVDAVARTICEVLNWKTKLYYEPGSFVGTKSKTLDSSQFLEKTGWKQTYTLKEGLSKLYQMEYA